jgi:hypothetical protein
VSSSGETNRKEDSKRSQEKRIQEIPVLTLMNEYKPLKLDAQVIPAQGTAFVTGGQGGKGRKGAKYLQDAEWNALSPEAKSKTIEAHKKGAKGGKDDDDKSFLSAKSAKTIKSLSKTMRLLEKDNKKLKKSISALQNATKMMTTT